MGNMKFNVITLFPEMFNGPLTESIIKRAREKGLVEINLIQLRDFADDKHRTVDDTPYGGGKGMVLKVDVLDRAISSVNLKNQKSKIILLSPRGKTYSQDIARELLEYNSITLVCGHYEGFDERVYDLVDDTISIGDYVLTGGEIPAMAIIDSISRLLPGVITEESFMNESFMNKDETGRYLLEYPQYTRPLEYKGKKVPGVLLSGNHAEIEKWRNSHTKINKND
jgi:tRNA (guanine37-N1)-methyltransferase